jgi:hypothetical protein
MTQFEPEEEPIGLPVRNWKKVKPARDTVKTKTVRRKIKRTMLLITVGLAIATSATLYGVQRVGNFYDKYTTELQSPILLQSPIKVEERAKATAEIQAGNETDDNNDQNAGSVSQRPAQEPKPATPKQQSSIAKTAEAKEPTGDVQTLAKAKVVAKWGESQWPAMVYMLDHESGSDPYAKNPTSGACGIPQALPCSKLLNVCKTLSNVGCQLDWMINYIESRYKTPSQAMAFHKINNWY